MSTKSAKPTPEMIAFREDLLELLNEHAGKLDSSEMLALTAYTAGQIMAMLDARKWTLERAFDLISKNIEAGNANAVQQAGTWMGNA